MKYCVKIPANATRLRIFTCIKINVVDLLVSLANLIAFGNFPPNLTDLSATFLEKPSGISKCGFATLPSALGYYKISRVFILRQKLLKL